MSYPNECPFCGGEVDEIGCEKTTTCPTCKRELKYEYDSWGNAHLVEVDEDDDIYYDR